MKLIPKRLIRTAGLALAAALALCFDGSAYALGIQEGGSTRVIRSADDAREFAEAVAAWKLKAATGEASIKSLAELRESLQQAVLAAPEDAGLADVLVDVEALWIERVALTGNGEAAEAALASLAAAVAATEASGGEASALERTRARAAARPAIATALATRAEARGARPAKRAAQSDVALQTASGKALDAGDLGFVAGLGERAAEPLAGLALASDGSPRPEKAVSPIRALLQVDPLRAVDVALRMVASNDLLIKREVAEALASAGLGDARLWTVRPGESDVPKDPRMADLLLRLVEAPSVSRDRIDRPLNDFIQNGWMPESLIELASSLPSVRTVGKWNHPSLRELYSRLLGSGNASTRNAALNYFVLQHDASPVFALAGSRAGDARDTVNTVLGPRKLSVYQPGVADQQVQETAIPVVDEAFARAVLEYASVKDMQDGTVFERLKRTAAHGPDHWLSVETLLELQKLEDGPGATIDLAFAMEGEAETRAVAALLDDRLGRGEPNVELLVELFGSATGEYVEAETFWAMHERLTALKTDDERLKTAVATYPLYMARSHPAELRRAIESVDRAANDTETQGIFGGLTSTVENLLDNANTEDRKFILDRVSGWPKFMLSNVRTPLEPGLWISVLTDTDAPGRNRMAAHDWLVRTGIGDADAEIRHSIAAAIADLLRNGDLSPSQLSVDRMGLDPDSVVQTLVEDTSIDDALLAGVASGSGQNRPLPLDLATRVLERIEPEELGDVYPPLLVVEALKAAFRERAITAETVAEYARRNAHVATEATYMLQRVEPEDALAILRGVLLADGPSTHAFPQAVSILGGLMTDDAAELLLEVARSPDRTQLQRDAAMGQFEQMVQWREAEARWRRSKSAASKRDAAVEALVATLESPDATAQQRLESVRGLGLLGAVEELPRLIELLTDEALGAAAREAIDALHSETERDR